MKTYLITMLIIFVVAMVTPESKTPTGDAFKALLFVTRLGFVIWTINLLVSL